MTDQPQKTDPAAAPPMPDSERSAYRTVLGETIYCLILGGLIGYYGAAEAPETLPGGVVIYAQLGALAGAIVGFLAGFVLGVRTSLMMGLKRAILGCLFATVFVAILGGVGGAIIFFTGGWNGDARSALVGALGGACFGILYGFISYRMERGKPGKP